MDGIELAARFSYITNSLRFCGPEEASGQFLGYIASSTSAESVKESLKKFEGLYPYLSVIAAKNKKEFTDYGVVEAYWIGNELLDNMDSEDIKSIIEKLMSRGLPKSIGHGLMKNLPDGMVPHHNFNVLYVGVGKTSGTVPTTIQNMDNCRISMGKVIGFSGDNLIVQTDILKSAGGKFLLQKNETKTAAYLKEMLPEVKMGDYVALHWGFACMALNGIQRKNLEHYTNKIVHMLNIT